ncbi:DUF1178 family protein [Terasakiella sp.]
MMIKYKLQCDQGHVFEDWFASSSKFDDMSEKGEHSCPECGSSHVKKTIMAPSVSTAPQAPSCASAPMCSNMGCPAMQG